ncbi:peroxisome biogenesis factor 10-like [Acipenser oxyrinchus oxyrinchus]|uniref:RING-type E3 ubiquitin transferase n=1 Tax=Acipenser oxyrinchus oxyrinchus TaxID=40147 RepID=A0AAD8CXP3_ACIOX|nr:peroxisome biogenesis factor 10-like [Acipenser oxyrinchus oxyrinchus]
MPLQPANQPQLIRSTQKDDYYQNCLRNNANEAFQTLAGSKKWLEWRKEIELLSDLAYYCLTTFSGFQTLGEEYVNILQVDPTKRKVPSRARRGVLICLHVFVPYLLDKTLVRLEHELQAETAGPRAPQTGDWNLTSFFRERAQRAVGRLTETQRRTLLHWTYILRQGVTFAHRLHVALFYINGAFYHLGKRVSGISYLRVRGLPGDDRAVRTSYKLLGAVSLLQLALTVALQINNFRQRQRARQEWKQYRNLASSGSSSLDPMAARTSRCVLCLEERRHSTATPCGHLFCWECITEWCNTKEECPLCREKFLPHRLVYLRNYK